MSFPEGKPGERRYGCWAGNPNGRPEMLMLCIEIIHPSKELGFVKFYGRQCIRKRGHGPNGEFCKQHAKRYEEMKTTEKTTDPTLKLKGAV